MPSTVFPRFVPLEYREIEDPPDLAELRALVIIHDELMEDCQNMMLNREEQKELDDLIAALTLREAEYWEGVPGETVEMLASHSDEEFPMIRQMLGAKPSDY